MGRRESTSNVNKKQIDGEHYTVMGIQPWDVVEQNGLDFFEGAVITYVMRWRRKDGVIDLDKAIHYLEKMKELAAKGHYGLSFKQHNPRKRMEEICGKK